MSDIEWRDPPAPRSGNNSQIWWDRMEPLTHHPGRWAVVHRGPTKRMTAHAQQLKKRNYRIPSGKWDFAARNGELFAMFIGPE